MTLTMCGQLIEKTASEPNTVFRSFAMLTDTIVFV